VPSRGQKSGVRTQENLPLFSLKGWEPSAQGNAGVALGFVPVAYTPTVNDLADLLADAMRRPLTGSARSPPAFTSGATLAGTSCSRT
jgi:hypothetical protein